MTPELTTTEMTTASRYLSETRDALVEATDGLSAAEWNAKPDPERWSIAETMEHIVVIEQRIHQIIGGMASAQAAESPEEQLKMDEIILKAVPSRTTRVVAPAPVQPSGRWEGPEALEIFLVQRERTIGLLSAPLLRGRTFPHPLFGHWDGYQWLLAAAGHSARHTEQIREARVACATSS